MNIKAAFLVQNKWKEEHQEYDVNASFCRLSRREQVIIFRLRTGHNRLRHHLFNKFRIGESDICPGDTEPMTLEHILGRCPRLATVGKEICVEHILGRCPRLATVRKEIWPEGTCLRNP
jgi:hypothetical protein